MSLSVILPNYNHGHLVLRALTSLARQDPDEIIVVDDASTDDSLAILQDFARSVPITILRNASIRARYRRSRAGSPLLRGVTSISPRRTIT